VDYFISCAIFSVCLFLAFLLALAYINRLIEIRIKPLVLRMNEIEREQNDIETRYTALQQMYQQTRALFGV